ncbi:MAG TPA: prepilin-type N-terminal cleavage/methylation domain-containing protein [Candidatus Paceibacterota bacterium]|nr:prepilin-type N-terminal cleavage/methylation domain-containing protein [Candidatus Paceibacterota bacterium]
MHSPHPRSSAAIRGFTLLELVVVIAIIAILAAVVIGATSQQKNAGGNAGVEQNLVNARSQIALYYVNNNNSYLNACADARIRKMVQAAAKAANITPSAAAYANTDVGDWNSEACHATAAAWAIWVPLRSSTSASPAAWCVDSTNASRQVTGSLASGAVACP